MGFAWGGSGSPCWPSRVHSLAAAPGSRRSGSTSSPSHITLADQGVRLPQRPRSLRRRAFAEFPEIRHAKGYEITVAVTAHRTQQTYSGPEFPDDTWSDYPALDEVHKGFHWFALSGYSVGSGCADAILGLEDAYEIVRSKVHLGTASTRSDCGQEGRVETSTLSRGGGKGPQARQLRGQSCSSSGSAFPPRG